jgi:hypothetical protein
VADAAAAVTALPFTGLALGALGLLAIAALVLGYLSHRAGRRQQQRPAAR